MQDRIADTGRTFDDLLLECETKVIDAAGEALRTALPNCFIYHCRGGRQSSCRRHEIRG